MFLINVVFRGNVSKMSIATHKQVWNYFIRRNRNFIVFPLKFS